MGRVWPQTKMAIQFCGPCGNILDTSTDKFPSELRQKRDTTIQLPRQAAVDTWGLTQEKCRKCGAEEVRYTALQLRSADEGTTLFYHCPQCSERWNEDN